MAAHLHESMFRIKGAKYNTIGGVSFAIFANFQNMYGLNANSI